MAITVRRHRVLDPTIRQGADEAGDYKWTNSIQVPLVVMVGEYRPRYGSFKLNNRLISLTTMLCIFALCIILQTQSLAVCAL